MDPIVSVKNLSVIYDRGKPNETRAVDDVSFDIYPGEYVILFGASGSGKSTLLYAIAGLERPSSGSVEVMGRKIDQMSEREHVLFHRQTLGMVFQQYELVPHLSAFDNVQLPLIFSHIPPLARKERALSLLSKFDIESVASRRPSMLSGGQQQRTAIARALVNDPPIILADEPVGNLDSKNAEVVLSLLAEINEKEGRTILHVTHNPRDLHHANRVVHVRDGKVDRVTRNPDKRSPVSAAEEVSDLELLRQTYPYLAERRLQSKMILHHLLVPVSMEQERVLEKTVEEYLGGSVTKEDLLHTLSNPLPGRGAAFYIQRARELTGRIVDMADEIRLMRDDPTPDLAPPRERARILRDHLLIAYEGTLSQVQMARLEGVLLRRLLGELDKAALFRELDTPLTEGGVGLNRRTANHFTEEAEVILMR